MNPVDDAPVLWSRARMLFERAIELPESEREAFLTQECAGDARLRDELQSLLWADAAPAGVLDAPIESVTDALAEAANGALHRHGLPRSGVIGAWRIVSELGAGGMGLVYLAERADGAYEQRAALKIVRGGLFSGTLEQRFLRERQILARLQHPNIARLLDGGFTADGSPYLVMELVEGQPITEWAERHRAELDRRLRLFLQACEAVSFAHRQLVVHRDLKPSNILVDGRGHVRLLDFGIAQLLDENSGQGGLTRSDLMLLTPEFAAPEQIRGEPPTTATDVYGLGAVLYELLSGKKAFAFASSSIVDVLRAIEQEPPLLGGRKDLAPAVRRRLAGDLETIVRRAMSSEPDRRYPTVDALAADIGRYLDGRPVLARGDGLGYRLVKYARRHRASVAA
ncbi:MAG: serine/threonine-protein kinase, partial [Steroidobacteraceae bacterium]